MNQLKCKLSKYEHIVREPIKISVDRDEYACKKCIENNKEYKEVDLKAVDKSIQEKVTQNFSKLCEDLKRRMQKTANLLDEYNLDALVDRRVDDIINKIDIATESLKIEIQEKVAEQLSSERVNYEKELIKTIRVELKDLNEKLACLERRNNTLEEFYENQKIWEDGLVKLDKLKHSVSEFQFRESSFEFKSREHIGTIVSNIFYTQHREIVNNSLDELYKCGIQSGENAFYFGSNKGKIRTCDVSKDDYMTNTKMSHSRNILYLFMRKNNQLISADYFGGIQIGDLATGCLAEFKNDEKSMHETVTCIFESENGILVIAGNNEIVIWDLNKNFEKPEIRKMKHKDVKCLLEDSKSDGKRFYSGGGGDSSIMLWDSQKGECLKKFRGHNDVVKSLLEHENGLLSVCFSYVKFWNVETAQCERTFRVQSDTYFESTLLNYKNGKILVAENNNRVIHVWNPKRIFDWNIIHDSNDDQGNILGHLWFIKCKHNEDFCMTGKIDGKIKLWNVDMGVCMQILNCLPNPTKDMMTDLLQTSNGDYLVSVQDMIGENVFKFHGYKLTVWKREN